MKVKTTRQVKKRASKDLSKIIIESSDSDNSSYKNESSDSDNSSDQNEYVKVEVLVQSKIFVTTKYF